MNATASKSDKCAMKKMKEPDLIELLEVGDKGGHALLRWGRALLERDI